MALSVNIVLGANTVHFNRNIAKATKKAEQQLKGFAGFAQRALDKINVGTLIGGGALYSLQQTSDQMQNLASKVRLATQSAEQYAAVQNQLRNIAQINRASFEGVVDLYAISQRALSQLGKSQQQVIDFTHNMTMAMNIGGGSAQAQAAALTQLGQALASGVLRGDEFNSVAEQAPILLELVAKEMNVATGELRKLAAEGKISADVVYRAVANATDDLKAMSDQMPMTISQGLQKVKNSYSYLVHDILNEQTKLSQAMAAALSFVADNMNALAALAAVTAAVFGAQMAHGLMLAKMGADSLSVAMMTKLQTMALNAKASMTYVMSAKGEADAIDELTLRWWALKENMAYYTHKSKEVITTTTAHIRSLLGLASGFDRASLSARAHTLAISGVTAAKRTMLATTVLVTRGVGSLGTAFMSLGRIINAHPLIMLGSIMAALVVRTHGLKGAMDSLNEALRTVGVLFEWFVQGAADGLVALWDKASAFLDSFSAGAKKSTNDSQGAFGGFFSSTHKGFVGVLQITARVFDLAGASVVTFAQYAWKNISSLGTAIVNVFKGVGNFIASVFEKLINNQINKINFIIDGMNAISGRFGGGTIPRLGQVQIGRMDYGSADFGIDGYTAAIAQNNAKAIESLVTDAYSKVTKSAQDAKDANQALAGSMANVASAGDKAARGAQKVAGGAKLAQDEINKLNQDYIEQIRAFQKTEWEFHKPFIRELDKIEFEIEHGKFAHALDIQKQQLKQLANSVDQSRNIDNLRKISGDWSKEIAMLGKESSLDTLLYDLYDVHNILSTFDKEHIISITYDENGEVLEKITAYEYYLKQAVHHDTSKATYELGKQNQELYNQLALLDAHDELSKNAITLQQEKIAFLGKYNSLLEHGFEAQYNDLQAQFERTEALKNQVFITEQYKDLVQSLKREEEKRLDTLNNQLDVLKTHAQITGAVLDMERAKQLISQSVGIATSENPYTKLNDSTESQYATLDAGLKSMLDNELLTEQERINIKAWGAEERLKIEKAHSLAMSNLMLSDSESMFGSLANIAKDGLGEQSRLYRAMFALQQGFAIAQAGIAMQQAISKGLEKGFPAGLADMSLAVSHGAKIVSAIRSVVMPVGQAHDGIMSVPKSGTWNLEKGERVLPKHTAQNLDRTLNNLQGGNVITVNVTVNSDGGDVKANHDMGKRMGQAIKAAVQTELQRERRQGGVLYGR